MVCRLPHLNAVIVCGKTGGELWPLTRLGSPRELTVFPGQDASLLEQTIERARQVAEGPITFVCHPAVADEIERAVGAITAADGVECVFVSEPSPRGSAFSVALAAASLRLRDPNAQMLVMPSHLAMDPDDRWEQVVSRAYRAAAQDLVAAVGITDAKLSANADALADAGKPLPYCMMRPVREIPGILGVSEASDFVFEPSAAQAQRYRSMGFVRYSGIMVLRASVALAELARVGRAGSASCEGMERVADTAAFLASVDRRNWASREAFEVAESLPRGSFEEAVFPHCGCMAVVTSTMECSSISSLAGLEDSFSPDERGNRVVGRAFAVDSEDTTVCSESGLVLAMGCEGITVINTRDAVLVSGKASLGEVEDVLSELDEAGAWEIARSSVRLHSWGVEKVLRHTGECTVKEIEIAGGRGIAEYRREGVDELWTVVCGRVSVGAPDARKTYSAGSQFRICGGEPHSVSNRGTDPAVLVCVEHILR